MIKLMREHLVWIVFSFISMTLGGFSCQSRMRIDAIEAGVAEWTVDPKTGERDFVYLECKEKQKKDVEFSVYGESDGK